MATKTISKIPLTFSGLQGENVEVFLSEFCAYAGLLSSSEQQRKILLRFSLACDALVWIRSQGTSVSFLELGKALIKRFTPANKTLSCLKQLTLLKPDGIPLLRFLDQARLVATSGGLSDEILVATVPWSSHLVNGII